MVTISSCPNVIVGGHELSPVIHLKLATPNLRQEDDEKVLGKAVNYCMEQGVALATAKYLPDEMATPPSR